MERRISALESAASKPAPNALRASWRPGLFLANELQDTQLRLGFRLQNDWAFFSNADGALVDAVGPLDDTVDFRRIWLELDGTLYERTMFAAHVDFAGGRTSPRNLFVGVKDVPWLGAVRVGHQQEPFSLEEMTSNAHLTFLERALAIFNPSYNTGVRVLRTLADKRMTLSYGVFRETDDTGRIASDDGYNFTARLTGLPLASDDNRRLVHLGLAASSRSTPSGYVNYRGRPVNRWAPFFVSATNIPAEDAALAGLEFAAVTGPLSLQAEWVMASPDTDGNDPEYSAYYAQVSYFLTGEVRPYDRAAGAFGRLMPARHFGKDGRGAWEVALRMSGADLTDARYDGGEMQHITAALNWYLNPNVRMMLNYVWSELKEVGEADAVLARFQIAF